MIFIREQTQAYRVGKKSIYLNSWAEWKDYNGYNDIDR